MLRLVMWKRLAPRTAALSSALGTEDPFTNLDLATISVQWNSPLFLSTLVWKEAIEMFRDASQEMTAWMSVFLASSGMMVRGKTHNLSSLMTPRFPTQVCINLSGSGSSHCTLRSETSWRSSFSLAVMGVASPRVQRLWHTGLPSSAW